MPYIKLKRYVNRNVINKISDIKNNITDKNIPKSCT